MSQVVWNTESGYIEIDEKRILVGHIKGFNALAILAQMPDSAIPKILTACLNAGREYERKEIRRRVHPIIKDMVEKSQKATNTVEDILKSFHDE